MRASTAETLQNANDEGSFYLTRSTQTSTVIATINYRRQTRGRGVSKKGLKLISSRLSDGRLF